MDGSSEKKERGHQGTKSYRRQQIAQNSQVTDVSRLVCNGPIGFRREDEVLIVSLAIHAHEDSCGRA